MNPEKSCKELLGCIAHTVVRSRLLTSRKAGRNWFQTHPIALSAWLESAQDHRAEMDRRRADRADRALDIASRAERSESLDRRIIIVGFLTLATITLTLGAWLIVKEIRGVTC